MWSKNIQCCFHKKDKDQARILHCFLPVTLIFPEWPWFNVMTHPQVIFVWGKNLQCLSIKKWAGHQFWTDRLLIFSTPPPKKNEVWGGGGYMYKYKHNWVFYGTLLYNLYLLMTVFYFNLMVNYKSKVKVQGYYRSKKLLLINAWLKIILWWNIFNGLNPWFFFQMLPNWTCTTSFKGLPFSTDNLIDFWSQFVHEWSHKL